MIVTKWVITNLWELCKVGSFYLEKIKDSKPNTSKNCNFVKINNIRYNFYNKKNRS